MWGLCVAMPLKNSKSGQSTVAILLSVISLATTGMSPTLTKGGAYMEVMKCNVIITCFFFW